MLTMRCGRLPQGLQILSRRRRARWGASATLLAVFLAHAASATITGICPDGSVFVVKSPADIPCHGAKEMEPHEVPPLRPEYLPRPYTWEVYEKRSNPNNPYNLLEAARKVRAIGEAGTSPEPHASTPEPGRERPLWGGSTATPPALGPSDLGLREAELRDLFQIVELSQRRAPATFVKTSADGRELMRISFARSSALESRLRARLGAQGPILAFTAVARAPGALGAQFTFVQEHVAFHPEAEHPEQFGVLQGQLGELGAGDAVLGYVVLPPTLDANEPMDIYWNDRRLRVDLTP